MQRKVFRVEQMIGARRAGNGVQPPRSDQVAVSETTPAPEAKVAARHELSARATTFASAESSCRAATLASGAGVVSLTDTWSL